MHTHAHLGGLGGGRARPGERRGQRGRARCRSRHRRAIPPTPSLESRCRLHPRLNHTRLHHTYTHTCACRRRLPLVPRSARWRTLPAGAAVFGLNSTPPKRIPMYAYLQVPVACSRRSPSLRVVLPPPVPLLCLSFFFCLPWVCLSLLLSFWLAVCVQSVSVCLREVCPCMRGRVRVCVSACVRACVCVRAPLSSCVCAGVTVTHTFTHPNARVLQRDPRLRHACMHTQARKGPSMLPPRHGMMPTNAMMVIDSISNKENLREGHLFR